MGFFLGASRIYAYFRMSQTRNPTFDASSTLYQRKCFAQHGNSNPSDLLSDVHKVLKFFFFSGIRMCKNKTRSVFLKLWNDIENLNSYTHSLTQR